MTRQLDAATRDTITRIIKSCVYGSLATVGTDGRSASVRPVCAFLEDDLSLLVPTHRKTRKIREIAAHPRVELCFVDAEHWQVRVAGTAEVVEETAVKKRLIETTLSPKLWRGFFPDGEHDAQFILYRVRPRSFEWMKEWELEYRRIEVDT